MEGATFDPTLSGAAAAETRIPTRVPGRDDFLRLLITQLQNQDPLAPKDDTAFVAQLATFSSLEQLLSVNDNLKLLASGQQNLVNAQALGLIGKQALVEGGDTVRIKGGKPDTLVYALAEPASQATLTIFGPDGTPVRTFQLDPSASGRVTLEWDGTDDAGRALADGDYRVEVNATGSEGDAVPVALFRALTIDGINFEGGTFALVSGDREIPFDQILEIRASRT